MVVGLGRGGEGAWGEGGGGARLLLIIIIMEVLMRTTVNCFIQHIKFGHYQHSKYCKMAMDLLQGPPEKRTFRNKKKKLSTVCVNPVYKTYFTLCVFMVAFGQKMPNT